MCTNTSDRLQGSDTEIIEAPDDGLILSETSEIADVDWQGPFQERDKYGNRTGHAYVRCAECGVEVLTGSKETAHHRPACPHSE